MASMYGAMRCLLTLMLLLTLNAGCARYQPFEYDPGQTSDVLADVPRPHQPIFVAVYGFPDLTGQHRQTPSGGAHYSRAVTQGGETLLIQALQKVSRGRFFRVLERRRLDNVSTERSVIRDQRAGARDAQGNPLPPPRPLLYAGVILEGGVIGYDTNHRTGGAGARFLGIGAHTQYREDIVTVSLRVVNSQTSEIWKSVLVSQRVYSVKVQGDTFRYVSVDEILEAEGGITYNEPRTIALQRAIERAVYMMVMQGVEQQLWSFGDESEGRRALLEYYRNLRPQQQPQR